MNTFELSRNWFNFSFENPEKIKPIHTAIYFFAIERCNRLGWKEKFSLPTDMTMEANGIKSYKTYKKALNEIINFGFIIMYQESKNQWTANIVALVKNTIAPPEADTKALAKAMPKHLPEQDQSTNESTIKSTDHLNASIIKQVNYITSKHINKETHIYPTFENFKNFAFDQTKNVNVQKLKLKYEAWKQNGWKDGNNKPIKNWKTKLLHTLPYLVEESARQNEANKNSKYD
ncbi:hypothetical protein ACOSP6_10930 [Tenacibaculum sp. MEBiC06402]|uniref:hypothetical protein n=1 Tax=unclassified Tenacibaculum TaxID=2635139 RepID=UPI003B9D190C